MTIPFRLTNEILATIFIFSVVKLCNLKHLLKQINIKFITKPMGCIFPQPTPFSKKMTHSGQMQWVIVKGKKSKKQNNTKWKLFWRKVNNMTFTKYRNATINIEKTSYSNKKITNNICAYTLGTTYSCHRNLVILMNIIMNNTCFNDARQITPEPGPPMQHSFD